MRKIENAWTRIAVVRKHDEADPDPPLWIFFLHRRDPGIQLRGWTLNGTAAPGENPLPGTMPTPDRTSQGIAGLKAWIDIYGDIEISDDLIARITLKAPPA